MSRICVSTSFLGHNRSRVEDAIRILEELCVDCIELGSTHLWSGRFKETVLSSSIKKFFVHNYCPPAKDGFILNIASEDKAIRKKSVDHIKYCISFSADIRADLYTFHPGFVAKPMFRSGQKDLYDFHFADRIASYSNAFERMQKSLEEIIRYAQRHAVKLAVETQGSVREAAALIMQRPDEYERLFRCFGDEIGVNLNLVHTCLAAEVFRFNIEKFLNLIGTRVRAVEVSHCNLRDDQHLPLVSDSFVFKYLRFLPYETPVILELRRAGIPDVKNSLNRLTNYLYKHRRHSVLTEKQRRMLLSKRDSKDMRWIKKKGDR